MASLAIGISFARVVPDPFGDSRDGFNASVWGTASRSLRADGVIDSKVGARLDEDHVYANHPPLITVEIAVAETLLGEHRWVTRMPAWLGTLAAGGLLWALMGTVGLSTRSRALGLLVGAGCQLLLGFGTMVDTPVTSLPFGLLAILLWSRDSTSNSWRAAHLGCMCLAVLAGWQSALLAALLVLVDVLRRRWGRAAIGAAAVAIGAALLVGWLIWVHGSLTTMVDELRFRSGLDQRYDMTFVGAIVRQARWLQDLLSPLGIGVAIVGPIVLLRRGGRSLDVGAALLATVVGYTLILSGGAYFHEYWTYWMVALVTLGGAAAVSALESTVATGRIERWWATSVPLAGATVFAILAVVRPVGPISVQDEGLRALDAVGEVDGARVYLYRFITTMAPFTTYETGIETRFLSSSAAVRQLAERSPRAQVLFHCEDLASAASCDGPRYVLVEARDLPGADQ